ncbi:MAG: putative nickel-responsive regulator [Phycisphaerae bacterium]|nr:putative nickel-responsive regulator [Phycisphaerae bacterium]
MAEMARVSLSIERPLLDKLERMVRRSRYTNRSEFVRDMIREQIVQQEWEADEEALGTITMIYDHHQRGLSDKLTGLQHDHHKEILVTSHVHLDHHLCAEVVLVRGRASHIRQIADELRKQRGVLHAALAISSTGKTLL